jgi:hypothetical protein
MAHGLCFIETTRMLQCAAMASNVAHSLKAKHLLVMIRDASPDAPGAVHHQSKDAITGPRFCIGTRSQRPGPLAKRGTLQNDEDDGSGLESSSDIPTVSVLQGSSCSRGCHRFFCKYGRDLNVYIHTY